MIPSYDYSGTDGNKAPMMHGPLMRLVLPDLDVCRSGRRFWVEVKTKSHATPTRCAGNRLEHGISARQWRNYVAVQDVSGCTVFLAICEASTREVRVADMNRLTIRESRMRKDGADEGAMVFFPRSELPVAYVVSAASFTWRSERA